ncbi:MAG: ABC transporter permease [Spirochaetaceae bacterium]|jgi:peptide/nickel transport system permease protein|nr:ABC transporter permease [Spirochaetaceae bacterium]
MKGSYCIRRLCIAAPTFIGITIIAYIVASLAPGSPLDALLVDPHISAAELERRKIIYGLDKPVWVQYINWLKALFHGDFGFSYATRRPVLTMIGERIGPTLLLAGTAIVLSLAVSLVLGILAASKPGSRRDYLTSGFSFLMLSTPNFFIGLALIFIFAAGLKILPSNGMYDSGGEKTIPVLLKHLVLPALVLSFQHTGSWIRHVRSSVLEVLGEDYIRTARAKGLTKTQVLLRHGLKNALIPVAAVIGMSLPGLISGAVVTEQVFSWPGLGSLMVRSIALRDYPVIMGITVIVSAGVLVINLIIDLLYGFLDPRIRYE